MAKKDARQPIDFNHMAPNDIRITNPERFEIEQAGGQVSTEYPKHLHKPQGPGLVHESVSVGTEREESEQRRAGFMSAQEANAANAKATDKGADKAPAAAAAAPKARKAPKAKK